MAFGLEALLCMAFRLRPFFYTTFDAPGIAQKHVFRTYTLGLQVASEKVFGVGARRVQIPSKEVLGGVEISQNHYCSW